MYDSLRLIITNLPMEKLSPTCRQTLSPYFLERLEADLRSEGLNEPLIVMANGDHYDILDGNARYEVFLKWGVESVPCIIGVKP
jgi:ParB-like chromosome segregation protein Spo0J